MAGIKASATFKKRNWRQIEPSELDGGLVLGSGLLDYHRVGLAYVGIVNLAGVELQVVFENQIH